MISALALVVIALSVSILAIVATAVYGVLTRINVTLAMQAGVHLAYALHSEDENIRASARAISDRVIVSVAQVNTNDSVLLP